MSLTPKLAIDETNTKVCPHCNRAMGITHFARTHSRITLEETIPFCDECMDLMLQDVPGHFDWDRIDKICQLMDIPFDPNKWIEVENQYKNSAAKIFLSYTSLYTGVNRENLDWRATQKTYEELAARDKLGEAVDRIAEEDLRALKQKWGANYDNEALTYLENLFSGLMATQNINGALQLDQAIKISKMSYEIDRRIADGDDFDKLLASYDKLVKAAEFTPKNVKNLNDFDSMGELILWMEKKGWKNKFYDGVTRDVVDETIKNFQSFNQRLYTNESEMGEQITERLQALKNVAQMENYYGTDVTNNLEQYENEGYNSLFKDEEQEEFVADIGEVSDGDED